MSEKTNFTKDQIIHAYIKRVMKKGRPHASVFKFCRKLGITESEFYHHFASLNDVAAASWIAPLHHTCSVVEADVDFPGYAPREKMLSFLYTYLENLQEHRSYYMAAWPGYDPRNRTLRKMACAYRHIVEPWIHQGIAEGQIASRGPASQAYPHVFSLHLLLVVDFWLKDHSPDFQRSDAFVEKTVSLAMDLLGKQAADSAVDLARFLLGNRR